MARYRLTENRLREIINEVISDIINEDNNTVWGIGIDRGEKTAHIMSKGVAQDYIQKNGEPRTVEEVNAYLSNENIGIKFYSEKLMAKKTGIDGIKTGITRSGVLATYVTFATMKGRQTKYISAINYDFNKSLINNLKMLFDKTPSNVDIARL